MRNSHSANHVFSIHTHSPFLPVVGNPIWPCRKTKSFSIISKSRTHLVPRFDDRQGIYHKPDRCARHGACHQVPRRRKLDQRRQSLARSILGECKRWHKSSDRIPYLLYRGQVQRLPRDVSAQTAADVSIKLKKLKMDGEMTIKIAQGAYLSRVGVVPLQRPNMPSRA